MDEALTPRRQKLRCGLPNLCRDSFDKGTWNIRWHVGFFTAPSLGLDENASFSTLRV